ncbi:MULTISPECIES: phosphonate ABC transporter, permease protein PhnE [unclassified Leifsonia]|uniref:phosphonate ABC transporter, permease protein PhnE n=1 Tax=unclassified Leifsonia TaxID=2663824 RepID=UPI000A18CE2A|nr:MULTISPECIES: phosphonate ABC transporter, permease protein PhnE [unclassified Leifsonia]QJA00099.1 phosphonate ABC transporter, permease protein PhnE [Leifsonia sp. PS1209]
MATVPLADARASTAALRRPRPPASRVAAVVVLIALLATGIIAFPVLGVSFDTVVRSIPKAEAFFGRIVPLRLPAPDVLWPAIGQTLGMVVLGTLLAAIISVPVAYLAAANTSPNRAAQWAGRFITVMARSIPDVVLAMVFAVLFTLGTLPGILAIGIHSVGMISKLFADAIEQIDEGPRLAIRAAGGSKAQEFFSGIVPQVAPSWVATVLHRNDINLRGSIILGYVGVAGLGYEMWKALATLDYRTAMALALVMFALCVLMEVVSSTVRRGMLGGGAARSLGARRVRNTITWVLTGVVIVGALLIAQVHWGDFLTFWRNLPLIKFWPPTFEPYSVEQIAVAMRDTVLIALAATVVSLLFSLVVGSLAARNVAPNAATRNIFRVILVAVRGVPELVLAIVLIIITGLGPTAAVFALAFGGVGLLGKLFADSIEEVPGGPQRALTAVGARRLQVYTSATVPPSVPAFVGHSFYLFDSNIRAATVLGVVGSGGIGFYLNNAARVSAWNEVFAFVLVIMATVFIVEGIAVWMRKALR